MKLLRRDRGVTTVEWVIVAMVIGVGCIAVFRTFKDSYMAPATNRMGDCIEAAAGDGNLCGGLATGGASSGGASSGGASTGGALAQNGPGVGGNGAAGAPAGGGGMTAGELANSVGGNGHPENPNAGVANAVNAGFTLEQAGEDGLIKATGIEIPKGLEKTIGGIRAGVGAAIAVPLDIGANGIPRTGSDAAALATKTAIAGAMGYLGGPIGAVAAVGLDHSIGYIADSVTGSNRYGADDQDSLAWQMAHGQAGTIGKEGLEAEQANEQRMLHDQLDYMHQQQQRDAETLREMMPH